MTRPVVGITTYLIGAQFGSWDTESALVPADYVRAVERAGGRPLLVPPSTDGIDETLDAVDGLIFSGGSDIDPEIYGHERHEETKEVYRHRDDGELALLRAALARDMPVLAICRGSQLLNVARGGDLIQHLPEVVGHDGHKEVPTVFSEHDVVVEEGTLLHALVGVHSPVKSHHHQGFGRVGEGLRVSAHAEDGSPEAVEAPGLRFALGVLWHPEAGEDARLFEALVAQAARHRVERVRDRGPA
jgi:gamma-glutamyl-gamma-aminobutyrate hydrolase PuuD